MDWEKLRHVISERMDPFLSPRLKATALLRGFGLAYIPLLFSVAPKVVELSDARAIVRIPLNRWTRNHLKSMYFGALAIGADCVGGLLAVHHIRQRRAKNVQLSFKNFRADFLRRPEGDVLFICEAGAEIATLVEEVLASGERRNLTVKSHAVLAEKPEERVAAFELTLSLKRKP
jgi:hypothetical protein